MPRAMPWLPEPPEGTRICLGMDGSETGDWTAIKAETVDGLLFTPRRPGSGKPTIWNPADHGGRMPRAEVDAAVDFIFDRFDVEKMYCDPPLWDTEIETWALRHGEKRVVKWDPTGRASCTPSSSASSPIWVPAACVTTAAP